jgi:importin subunit beta-1
LIPETLLIEHTPSIFQFLQIVYDEDHSETVLKQSAGLIGDLADTFPNGQLKEVLLQDWVASLLKTKIRNSDIKKTLRWAREVSIAYICCLPMLRAVPQMVKRATQ